ncbi:hypothetical protein [Nocardia alba]|uniref:hypothetical protein n=1 Tax=Nocardia alba TaxID=225051 RepID=UPI00104B1C63|nr:hypothetical protein [Nocardia alba]
MKAGRRALRVEIADPRQDPGTPGWRCVYRVVGGPAHTAHGPDRLAAIYAALVDISDAATLASATGNPTDPHHARIPEDPRLPVDDRPVSAVKAREFGPPLGAKAVQTTEGPVVITLGRPRQDPERPHTYLCPFRIDDRTEAFGQGIDEVRAVISAVRGVGSILGIPLDWPGSRTPPSRPSPGSRRSR